MNQASRGSRVVFVGNIPFELTEEQLIDIFKEVGPVQSFRLLFDRETGRPKGYGFCEYYDAETAASAVRNLNEYDIGGRQLRVDYAAMDPHPDNQRHQRQHQHPPPRSQPPPPAMPPPQAMPPPHQQHVPPMNAPKPPGPATSVDEISRVLASMNSEQLFVLMSQMKQMSFERPAFTRDFLTSNPQVAYALFQAMVMMNIVDPNIITRIISNPVGGSPAAAGSPMAANTPTPPQPAAAAAAAAPSSMQPPPQAVNSPVPPQPAAANMPMATGSPVPPNVQEQQKALLMQVMHLTEEQINALPAEHRDQIRQLKAQLMSQPQPR
ncbi:hypothetical protein VTP01DRAFT_7982 [Rhizomucor pusillus]|uniref:uncharacterized protein n=1 Tax=Rhizomucor pusillus TaxID=4840 RepID=UPI003744246B